MHENIILFLLYRNNDQIPFNSTREKKFTIYRLINQINTLNSYITALN
jgi:hypothetical protein